ncbi:MAG: hypothetical protein J7K30_12955 [Deltaproteobacteria bacterium]|nr:hypothetical protein [Deltaproteobacteria bacterium]
MSLTSQLKDKNSPVRQFFTKYENKKGAKECLKSLQSSKEIQLPPFKPASFVVYAFIGTSTDYLLRYTANGNHLNFEETIAHQALEFTNGILNSSYKNIANHLETLYKLGKEYIDGRDATDHEAAYSATALAMMDNVFRSGRLPQLFLEPITKEKKELISA